MDFFSASLKDIYNFILIAISLKWTKKNKKQNKNCPNYILNMGVEGQTLTDQIRQKRR